MATQEHTCCDKQEVRKGSWTPEEDEKLFNHVKEHGHGPSWSSVPKLAGLERCGQSCRNRWMNHLQPNLKHGQFSEEEVSLLFRLQRTHGNKWSRIAKSLPGRTDNGIKNFWNTNFKKLFTDHLRRQFSSSFHGRHQEQEQVPGPVRFSTPNTVINPTQLPVNNLINRFEGSSSAVASPFPERVQSLTSNMSSFPASGFISSTSSFDQGFYDGHHLASLANSISCPLFATSSSMPKTWWINPNSIHNQVVEYRVHDPSSTISGPFILSPQAGNQMPSSSLGISFNEQVNNNQFSNIDASALKSEATDMVADAARGIHHHTRELISRSGDSYRSSNRLRFRRSQIQEKKETDDEADVRLKSTKSLLPSSSIMQDRSPLLPSSLGAKRPCSWSQSLE